jgi:hypothetical protein
MTVAVVGILILIDVVAGADGVGVGNSDPQVMGEVDVLIEIEVVGVEVIEAEIEAGGNFEAEPGSDVDLEAGVASEIEAEAVGIDLLGASASPVTDVV